MSTPRTSPGPATRHVLDPTNERAAAERTRCPRPAALAGLTVGLLDISKARGNVFLDRIEQHLRRGRQQR